MTTDVKPKEISILRKIYSHIVIFIIVLAFYAVPMSVHVYLRGGLSESSNQTYTLTNGDKTVVFQSMTHIGLPSFYKAVGEELVDYRSKGYSIFLEGLGHYDDKKLKKGTPRYAEVVNKYNELVAKTNQDYLKQLINTKYVRQGDAMAIYYSYDDRYIDFTTEELKQSIEVSLRDKKGNETDKEKIKELYSDTLGNHNEAYKQLMNNERSFILSSNLNDFFLFTVVDNYIMPTLRKLMNLPNLDADVTMAARNKKISDAIISSANKKIYIVYGALHFNGVFDNLKKNDQKWEIINTTSKVIFRR